MSKEIKEFIDSLKHINNFEHIDGYDFNKYPCEMSLIKEMLAKVDYQGILDFWKNKISNSYGANFEIKHPLYTNVITRAVYNINYVKMINYIFFIDKDNKFPWIMAQMSHIAQVIILPGKIIYIQDFWGNKVCDWCKVRGNIFTSIDISKLTYKNIPWGFTLFNCRPMHFFYYQYFTFMDIIKKQNIKFIANDASFFKPFNLEKQDVVGFMPNIIPIDTTFGGFLSDKANYFLKEIVNESIRTLGVLSNTHNHDLTIWLGIPGERRTWLTQLEGIPSILKNIARYFPKIKVYVDGMTAHDGERIEVTDNLKAFTAIKAEVDKLNLDIDMESLSGYDYRSKICYCSTCDMAISDVGTTALVPFYFCKKPGVIFFASETYAKKDIEQIKNQIPSILAIDASFLKSIANKENALFGFNFHIPWQHLYNLAAQSLEEIKGVKMHRLDVPPVELVAKQYDLEQELGIKIPIESVALFDEVKQELNKISKEQKSNKELLESVALFDEVKQELNKISKEQKSNKELLTQIISGSMILQNYVNNKNLQDQSIINQNKNLIAELLYCKEQNSILEQKLAPKAKSRIHNQLSYKLGQAMIANSKSIWGYIRMPYVLSYIKDMHKKEQIAYNEKIKANPSLKLPPLETYPDYKEALKEKECLTYKLGEAMIEADKSPLKLGYLTIWFKCKKIQKECKNR
ncbi:hypothetical protein [Campylobacter sp. P0109]|uniref:hypothetical protein n=1 Tax=Campylobacter sp. P0109 TaxID=1895606 RepID=UPI001F29B011|nr:hypothetical protein [Campylobacter sp. P0109]